MNFIPASARKLVFVCVLFVPAVNFSVMAQNSDRNNEAEFDAGFALEVEGKGITVTGTRTPKRLKDTPVPVEVISAEEIENSGADTVVDVLNDYGLVYTGNGMGDYVQMQGMGKNRILYLIDGRRVSGRIAQRLKGETLPLANVERMEIIRGPQSALYGSDALGGVINIITKRPPDTITFSASLKNRFLPAYNDPNTDYTPEVFADFNPIREQNFNGVFGFPLGKSSNSIDFEASRGAFYYNEQKSASILPQYYRGRLGFDSRLEPVGALEVRFGGSGMLMRRDDRTTARGSLNRLDYLRLDGFAEASLRLLSNAMLTFRLYDNYYQRNRDAYSALNNTWTTGERYENDNVAALEVQGMFEATPHLLFTAGVEGAFSSMEKYNFSKNFVYLDRESLFFQAEYFTIDLFSVTGGLRLERNSLFGFAASPKVAGMVHLGKAFRILGGAGVGYRAPDFSDLYMERDDEGGTATPVFGNPDLKPEYALGFNLVVEYSDTLFFVQVNGYYSELFNEIGR
ncbi:MAG: TonB-dependent receptor, partial [Spirochaetaceae bacterium]|nr:TonB-dependent receptor [Spirochaetaceae bacterium]